MKYRIVRVELKDENTVLLYLKKIGGDMSFLSRPDFSDPAKMLEFSMQMGIVAARKIEELMQFDAFITLEYEQYNLQDLKVGDVVE
ncbi:MAG TPA: hypothetical protein EYP30_08665, partial [Archaeoglobaceae archaeon]|nr:hypothetical protein [Archaeoglobaceae archaeon]